MLSLERAATAAHTSRVSRYAKFVLRFLPPQRSVAAVAMGLILSLRFCLAIWQDVPGPGAANSGVDRGYIILGLGDQEFDRFITPQAVEDMIRRAAPPVRMRVLDTKLFKEIVQARDNEIPLVEAA